jgi:hypothetical protein
MRRGQSLTTSQTRKKKKITPNITKVNVVEDDHMQKEPRVEERKTL